jgi:predicted secreted protein
VLNFDNQSTSRISKDLRSGAEAREIIFLQGVQDWKITTHGRGLLEPLHELHILDSINFSDDVIFRIALT